MLKRSTIINKRFWDTAFYERSLIMDYANIQTNIYFVEKSIAQLQDYNYLQSEVVIKYLIYFTIFKDWNADKRFQHLKVDKNFNIIDVGYM